MPRQTPENPVMAILGALDASATSGQYKEVRNIVHTIRADERQRCAKAVCVYCARGEELEYYSKGGGPPLAGGSFQNMSDWLHPHGTREWGVCSAAAIHALDADGGEGA